MPSDSSDCVVLGCIVLRREAFWIFYPSHVCEWRSTKQRPIKENSIHCACKGKERMEIHYLINTSFPLWTCSGNCSRAGVCPALPLWRQPGSPGSPQTGQSPGRGRWRRPPRAWRLAHTARSPQSDSTTRSGSSQSLQVQKTATWKMSPQSWRVSINKGEQRGTHQLAHCHLMCPAPIKINFRGIVQWCSTSRNGICFTHIMGKDFYSL